MGHYDQIRSVLPVRLQLYPGIDIYFHRGLIRVREDLITKKKRAGGNFWQRTKWKDYKYSTFFTGPYRQLSRATHRALVIPLRDYLLIIKLAEGNLQAREILNCNNQEIRRYLIENYGFEKFVRGVGGRTLHKDGESQLIRISATKLSEPIVVVKVKDASTDKTYLLRVPPTTKTCKAGIAWTFGLTEEEWNPVKET